jgi:hypothetical protein
VHHLKKDGSLTLTNTMLMMQLTYAAAANKFPN